MQTLINKKSVVLAIALFSGITIASLSCKKSSSSTASATDTVTSSQAADAMTEAVVPSSAGVVAQTQTATVVIVNGSFPCGLTTDSSFSGASAAGAAVTYSYSFSSSRTLTCANNLPASFAYQFAGGSSYSAPRVSSNDSSAGQFSVTGLQASASSYTFNENYVRNGSESSKVGNEVSYTSTITIQTTDLVVDKSTEQILSGTATVSMSGATTAGKSFSFTGTLTFNGSQTATLVLGDGSSYSIIWS